MITAGIKIEKCMDELGVFCYAAPPMRGSTKMLRYEIKFSIDGPQALQVLHWAAEHLTLDSHASNAAGGLYRTNTLYLDTKGQDVYHHRGRFKHHKFRLRRYWKEPFAFLERKSRWSNQVEKYRTMVAESDLPLLASYELASRWQGAWFHQQILAGELRPAYQVDYERAAYVGTNSDGPMRLTMDTQIRSRPADGWRFTDFAGLRLFTQRVILELKYCNFMPSPFESLIQSMDLTPKRISKYRLAVQTSERISRYGRPYLQSGRMDFATTASPDD